MSEPYLAQIQGFGFNFPPRGWLLCDGQILPINQYQSLYSLLGTTYGGDGRTTFGLPDLRGRVPMHFDGGHPQGQKSGADTISITTGQMPQHTHALHAFSENADVEEPEAALVARGEQNTYVASGTAAALHSGSIKNTGNNGGHNNMQPSQVISYCIAIQGLFPSRN